MKGNKKLECNAMDNKKLALLTF